MVWFYILWSGLFGLLIGSFLNVCIYRLPRKENIAVGRSHCTSCGHTLSASDLIPVLSYLLLRRRCRYCGQPISPRYAIVESLTAILYMVQAAIIRPQEPDRLLALLLVTCWFTAVLLVWAAIRLDGQKPPRMLYLFMVLPAIIRLILQPDHSLAMLVGMIGVVLVQLVLVWLNLITRDNPDSGHEILTLSVSGLMLGILPVAPVMVFECILLLILATSRKLKTQWFPCLMAAAIWICLLLNLAGLF